MLHNQFEIEVENKIAKLFYVYFDCGVSDYDWPLMVGLDLGG